MNIRHVYSGDVLVSLCAAPIGYLLACVVIGMTALAIGAA